MGNDYGKFIEIFNEQVKKVYDINTSKSYFDCTNFYFEIDKEDDFRRIEERPKDKMGSDERWYGKNGYGCLFAYRRCKSLLYDRTNL